MAAEITTMAKPKEGRRTAWKALEAHHKKMRGLHLRDLFANDPMRGERMAVEGAGIYLDYSKNRITHQTLKLLVELADASSLQVRIDAMFRGERVNITEDRPALHVALRAPREAVIVADNKNVLLDVHAVLDRMSSFCDRIRSGEWVGYTGKRIRNIVNIGIGGSHLGPAMAYHALRNYSDSSRRVRFVANNDRTDYGEGVRDLAPGYLLDWGETSNLWLDTSSQFPRMRQKWHGSALTRQTRSNFGIGWADAIRCVPQLVCRPC